MKGNRDGDDLDERYTVGKVEIERFQEVSEEHGYDYRGYWYTINCGIYFCVARTYDDAPQAMTVHRISPPSHGHPERHPYARFFCRFISRQLAFNRIQIMDLPGGYLVFDPATEEIVKEA